MENDTHRHKRHSKPLNIYSRSSIIRNSINRKVRLTGLHEKKKFQEITAWIIGEDDSRRI